MCLESALVRGVGETNWDGGAIVNRAIVRSTRTVVGRAIRYDVDPREYLLSERNAVMRRAIEEAIPKFVARRGGDAALERYRSRKSGGFDFRAHAVADFVAHAIDYEFDSRSDVWQFPDETLAAGAGDCEDRALLLASLLLASGVSSFNVKVALGALRVSRRRGAPRDLDHTWVMYRAEAGRWLVLDPHAGAAAKLPASRQRPARVQYVPRFLFNDVHLWALRPEDARTAIELKKGWGSVAPRFVGLVHKTILNDALRGVCPPPVLVQMNRHFTALLGKDSWTIDDTDVPGGYHPADHFDNAFIAQGWARVRERLAAFGASGGVDADAFVLAAHGISDFYAHSNYAHACLAAGKKPVPVYAGNASLPGLDLDYTMPPFDIAHGSPSFNDVVWQHPDLAAAAARFSGRPISGRYAQRGDSHSLTERITYLPDDVTDAPDFKWRATLPHHDEIAVDEEDGTNAIYSKTEFARQFRARRDVAVRHVREAYLQAAP